MKFRGVLSEKRSVVELFAVLNHRVQIRNNFQNALVTRLVGLLNHHGQIYGILNQVGISRNDEPNGNRMSEVPFQIDLTYFQDQSLHQPLEANGGSQRRGFVAAQMASPFVIGKSGECWSLAEEVAGARAGFAHHEITDVAANTATLEVLVALQSRVE